MTLEQDIAPPANTFRREVWGWTGGLAYLRAYWGRRLVGSAIGLMSDLLAEGATQAFYSRLPGHPEQAQDSLEQVGFDRRLARFRGETNANYAARVRSAWDDYRQAGTTIVMLRVINQWGAAGWPATWDPGLVAITESGIATQFTKTLTISYGGIIPSWTPEVYGSPGLIYGAGDLYYGIGQSTDIEMLLYLVRKWKRASTKYYVRVFYDATNSVTFTVG